MIKSKGIQISGLIVAMLLVSMAFMPAVSAEVEFCATSEKEMTVGDAEIMCLDPDMEDPDMDFPELNINPSYSHIRLKPGSSNEITVTVENKDNKTIRLEPRVVASPYSENIIDQSWINITPASKDIEPDAKQKFNIKVNIPEDADIGSFAAEIIFTDDVQTTPEEQYSPYINTMQLDLFVWTPPKVLILTPYIVELVEPGQEYDYEIKLKNVADMDIAIDPKISENEWLYPAFEKDAITITAPSTVKAGETAVINVHLEVPDDAKGAYDGAIDLNIDDPSMDEWPGQVQLNFEVWIQPDEPYIKKFTTSTEGPITIEVSSSDYLYNMRKGETSFDVELEDGSGKVELDLIKKTYSGTVRIGAAFDSPWIDGEGFYNDASGVYVETYEAPGAIGEWTLGILPINTQWFDYSITIGASE